MKISRLVPVFLVVLMLIGVGVYLWLTPPDRPGDDSTVNAAGPGLKTYCSDYGYLCFDYPDGWKLSTHMTRDEAVSPETTTVTSRSGDVVVTYRPDFGATNHKEDVIMSVIGVDATRTPDLRVVSMVDRYNGGGIVDSQFTPQTFVTDESYAANGEVFVAGATITSDREPVFHVFRPDNNDKLVSYFYVKYDQNDPSDQEAGHYVTHDDALAALNDPEARQAYRILQSARYKNK